MPDDERSRRRLGDATKSRIADLASGWSVDAPRSLPDSDAAPEPPAAAAPASAPTRTKPKTNPPPPPGSPERKALEDKIVATTSRDDDATDVLPPERRRSTGVQPVITPPSRSKPATVQPVLPPARAKPVTGSQPAVGDRPRPASIPPSIPAPPPAVIARAKSVSGAPLPATDRFKSISVPPLPASDRSKPVSVPPPLPPERSKPASIPPPAPGSPERSAHERSKPASLPPKPSGPKFPRADYDGPSPPLSTNVDDELPFKTEARTPAVIVDIDAFAGNKLPMATGELQAKAPSVANVPVGEFGSIDTKQRTTLKDASEVVTPVEDLLEDDDDRPARGDPTAIERGGFADPATVKFERGDPTHNTPPDATEIRPPRSKHMTGGTLRRHAALRRKRGLYGDVRYVFTALFGVRRSRRELVELEHRQEVRATSRRRHLVTLGRAAASMDNFDHPALGPSRDTLALIEDERAQHQGAVAASDAELDRVRRDRQTNVKAHAEALAKCDGEIAELAKKLEPLEKDATTARKKSAELRDELSRIDRKIADTEALLVSVKGEKLDKAGVQADIATFKANKQAVLRDEPHIAAQLDELNPRIAALDANHNELLKKKIEVDKADADDQRRTLELLEAIGAKRKVVERASADAETARDNALFELGERLYVDRPQQLTPQLSPIDRIDLEIGEDERRAMELKEILSNIDKAKFARGLAMIILALGAAATLAWFIYSASG